MHLSQQSSDSTHRFSLYPPQELREMVHTSSWMLVLSMPYEGPQAQAELDEEMAPGQTRRHVEPYQHARFRESSVVAFTPKPR